MSVGETTSTLQEPGVPGRIHDQEAAGGHRKSWQCHQVLGSGPVVHISAFQDYTNVSINRCLTFLRQTGQIL